MSAFTGIYGQDSAVVPALDQTFTPLQDDAQVLLNDCAKLLTTPQGYVWWSDAPTMDVRDLLLDSSSRADRENGKAQIEEVLAHDPRIATAQARLTNTADALVISLAVVAVTGATYRFTLSTDGQTVTIERAT